MEDVETRHADRAALAALGLAGIGLVMAVSSAALKMDLAHAFLSHGLKLSMATLWLLLLTRISPSFYQRISRAAFVATLLLVMAATFLFPPVNGARRWIFFSGYSFQPSEMAKISLIILTANLASRAERGVDYYKALVPAFLLSGILFLQPDVGTALLCLVIAFAIVFVAGLPVRHVFVLLALGILAFTLAFVSMAHVRARVTGFFNPSPGSQVSQALVAVGSGGILGKGLGQGVMKLGHLPQCRNDFIFAVLCEELGFIGGASVLLLLLLFSLEGFRVSARARDRFSGLVAFGAVFSIFFQSLAHVGVNMALAPAKGIDFPLLGSGGSSLCFALGSVGILRSVAISGKRDPARAGSPVWEVGKVANVERYGVIALCFLVVIILGISLWGGEEEDAVKAFGEAAPRNGVTLRETDPGLFAGSEEGPRERNTPNQGTTGTYYVVKKGDVLSRIAKRKYGTTRAVSLILKANPWLGDGSIIRVGQKIYLPGKGASKR